MIPKLWNLEVKLEINKLEWSRSGYIPVSVMFGLGDPTGEVDLGLHPVAIATDDGPAWSSLMLVFGLSHAFNQRKLCL